MSVEIRQIPQAGEWWQHNMQPGLRCLIVGVATCGKVLIEFSDGMADTDTSEHIAQIWHHLPGCTGWDWKEPEPVLVKRVLLDLWTSEQIVEQRSAGWGLFVTARDMCPSPVSRFIRVHYDDVAGFFIDVPNNSGEG